METTIVLLIVLALVVGGGIWLLRRMGRKKDVDITSEEHHREVPTECCGAHEVCEFDGLIKKTNEIVYFEDEDLDRFKGIGSHDYADDQIEEMRDVLYTLHASEINNWLRSLELRGINLPDILNQEARQLLADYITQKAS